MTAAEMVKRLFEESEVTVSIPVLAKEHKAERETAGPHTIYTFRDKSRLIVCGRGRNHTMRTDQLVRKEP